MLRSCLTLLIFVRLLWPPGICACHLFEPEPVHHEHDHPPSCPAAKMAMALHGLKQEAPHDPPPSEPAAVVQDDCSPAGACGALIDLRSPADPDPPELPRYLTLRALLI